MSTYNRGHSVGDAIQSVLAEHKGVPAPPLELIVVDNNSTDRTQAVVTGFALQDPRVRYVFEPQQGLSFARNAGISVARAPLIAFTDDDVRVDPQWAAAIVRAFREHPRADMVGGRVLPMWPSTPPAWLTREHWAPLALADHGDSVLGISPERAICLVGANVAFRQSVFDAIGGFATEFQRVKDGIGSLEDHHFLLRFLGTGRTGLYDPRIVVHAEIQPNRLERDYHRRWHTGHGHFHALLKSDDMESTSVGRLFGVPAHLYRQAARDAVGWLKCILTAKWAQAFHHELRLRFFKGFFRTRTREFLRSLRRQPKHERWSPGSRRSGATVGQEPG